MRVELKHNPNSFQRGTWTYLYEGDKVIDFRQGEYTVEQMLTPIPVSERMKKQNECFEKNGQHNFERMEADGTCWCICGAFTDTYKHTKLNTNGRWNEAKPIYTY